MRQVVWMWGSDMSRFLIGREKLMRKLKTIAPELRAELSKAVQQGANEIADMQRRVAPQDEGDLKRSIRVHRGKWRDLPGDGDLTAHVVAGEGLPDGGYASYVEFGKSGQPGANFFFGPYRALRKRVRSRMSRAGRAAIKKAFSK